MVERRKYERDKTFAGAVAEDLGLIHGRAKAPVTHGARRWVSCRLGPYWTIVNTVNKSAAATTLLALLTRIHDEEVADRELLRTDVGHTPQ